ncbi:16S rRNA (uracil(1498)-N(3))-methyltransferase [Lactococcus protaetiae]|uniref:Ribosomal RNA small subunit methyltransferase E n=1 Tax=Lactococcus protaetiae TaxID=2592653 RepID=A0A514Z6W1_9LACT|nr:16S rRNA (uracil(1498)-N(3))-methyltransferase [Lactococcus protaetiae]QDK70316.1 16S rRNA (uracil(1498)-N(3))-methyltransferase [Lactococcus protaetiae]
MANQYFVFRELPELNTTFTIENKAAAHHIFTVMRAQAGEKLQLVFDGGKVALAEVVSPDEHAVKLTEILSALTELPVEVTVAVGFPKADKLDFITEKATELGAGAIWAAPFKWSVVKYDHKKLTKKQDKLEKITLGAAEQSRRQILPDIKLFDQLSVLTEKFSEFDSVLIAYEESAKAGEKTVFHQALTEMSKGQKLLIIFGPEGGIAPEEIEKFEQLGARKIGLGPRIMRAETAPLYALSVISAYFELL